MRLRENIQLRYQAAKTADETLSIEEVLNGLFTNRGASGTGTLTLPDPSTCPKAKVRFVRVASQALRVDPSATGQILDTDGTALTAGFYQELGSDGAVLELVSDGTNWVNIYERGTINNGT